MPKLSVAERLDKIAQRKAKDERLEARLKLIQKKADSCSAAEISRLAIKASIDQLSPAALYGAFLQIAADAADPEKLAAWEAKGHRSLRTAENDNREVAIVKFPAKPAADTMPVCASWASAGTAFSASSRVESPTTPPLPSLPRPVARSSASVPLNARISLANAARSLPERRT